MKLSLLIPTLNSRSGLFQSLINDLYEQRAGVENGVNTIEILHNADNGELAIGRKRNLLLERAKGNYVAFIDDDDAISPKYIKTLIDGIATDPDCISLRGIITTNGRNPQRFEHSLKYKKWETIKEPEVIHQRTINHLNCIRADIAKQFKFPESNFGEDHFWSKELHRSGLLKNEYYTTEILYYYKYISRK